MAPNLITPTHRALRKYYENVTALRDQHVFNELNVRSALESLLADTARLKGWTLVPKLSGKPGGSLVRPDGTVRDANTLPRAYGEAKDTPDDLEVEIQRHMAHGYALSNLIFEDTQTGVRFQSKQKINGPCTLGNPKDLAALLNQFFSYTEPDIEGFEEAVEEFKERAPDLARRLVEKIQHAHKDNPRFQYAFEKFFDLWRTALNPNIRLEAVDEMLVQHLLTERPIRTVFNNPEFAKRRAIAAESYATAPFDSRSGCRGMGAGFARCTHFSGRLFSRLRLLTAHAGGCRRFARRIQRARSARTSNRACGFVDKHQAVARCSCRDRWGPAGFPRPIFRVGRLFRPKPA